MTSSGDGLHSDVSSNRREKELASKIARSLAICPSPRLNQDPVYEVDMGQRSAQPTSFNPFRRQRNRRIIRNQRG
jgi:hypothetical protein